VVKEAALFNLSTLRSQTVFRTPDGHLFGWEGCDDTQGCCFGSCTHVWNYEQATPFLFGDLALRMREVEFLHATRADGGMSFRVELPLNNAKQWSIAAADGQMGCIMKLYRDWQLSGNADWLRKLWPMARKALEFCWRKGGWDADKDGVMEGCQHNTMDVEYYGPNPQMGIWYLGALRACEEMARHLGEADFADECHRLYTNGRQWIDEHLFNGDYYEHEIRPVSSADAIFPMLIWNMGAKDLSNPVLQLGAGCLVDQLVGQYMAHVCGLGYLVEPEHVRQTLQSIMKYNFKTGFHDHFNHLRSFVLNDESALLMATYPRGQRPQRPFPYYNEVMTGFEYTAAVGMIYEGITDDGLRCIQAVRDRYDGRKRSPFDEAECGHHYARAMASWGAILALTGFHYSAVTHRLEFAASDQPSTHFWSNGYAWGTCQQIPNSAGVEVEVRVLYGSLNLRELSLKGCGEITFDAVQTITAGNSLRCDAQRMVSSVR
jgi:non-lysosomal glucosylceramidase